MLVFNVDFSIDKLPMKELIRFAEAQAVTADIAKEYLITSLAEDENILSELCERAITIGNSLKSAALEDLTQLWNELNSDPLAGYVPSVKRGLPFREYQQSMQSLVSSANPQELLNRLITHYSAFGGGKNSRYIAFRWHNGLIGADNPDDISLSRLFCLDGQRETLTENTLAFLRGKPSDNVLLYGSKGSGKSSMVKAVLNEYYREGLRMVEVSREHLSQLPQVTDCIKSKRLKYIVFMDDLSFEENEYEYKGLKVILEGQIEKQPQNVLFYATSNRRHVVNERWSERQGDEVHIGETMDEKLSLAERFGISLYFPSPGQNEYFEIIEGLLEERNIPMSDQIRADAVKWELNHGGRSGRTAARFARAVVKNT